MEKPRPQPELTPLSPQVLRGGVPGAPLHPGGVGAAPPATHPGNEFLQSRPLAGRSPGPRTPRRGRGSVTEPAQARRWSRPRGRPPPLPCLHVPPPRSKPQPPKPCARFSSRASGGPRPQALHGTRRPSAGSGVWTLPRGPTAGGGDTRGRLPGSGWGGGTPGPGLGAALAQRRGSCGRFCRLGAGGGSETPRRMGGEQLGPASAVGFVYGPRVPPVYSMCVDDEFSSPRCRRPLLRGCMLPSSPSPGGQTLPPFRHGKRQVPDSPLPPPSAPCHPVSPHTHPPTPVSRGTAGSRHR